MSMIQEDFRLSFEIIKIGSIKSWGFTEVDGNTYPPSVKLRATNIEAKEDKTVGVREVETIVDFQISTTTVDEAVHLVEVLRKFRADKKPIYLVGSLPNKEGSDNILKIKSTEPFADFLSRNKITLNIKTEK